MKKKREWKTGDRVVIARLERVEEGSSYYETVFREGTIRHLYARGVGVETADGRVWIVNRKGLKDPVEWEFAVKKDNEPLAIRQLAEGVTDIRYAPLG